MASKEHDSMVTVYNPCGTIQTVDAIPLAPRLSDLKGKRIGLVNNSKPGTYLLFPHIKKLLEDNFGAKVLEWLVPFGTFPDKPEILNEILSKCDAVISGLGD